MVLKFLTHPLIKFINMDIAIPFEKLEIGNISMSQFQKKGKYPAMSELSYQTPFIQLSNLNLLTQPLEIDEWNPIKGRLRLNCNHNHVFENKMLAIQEYFIGTIFSRRDTIINDCSLMELSLNDISNSFKSLCSNGFMNCYISTSHLFPLYERGERINSDIFNSILRPGKRIRLILQLNGVSVLPGNVFRIQHQILGAYIIN